MHVLGPLTLVVTEHLVLAPRAAVYGRVEAPADPCIGPRWVAEDAAEHTHVAGSVQSTRRSGMRITS